MSRLRWWPAALIAGLWLARVAWVWLGADLIRQWRVLHTLIATLLALFLLLVWFALFSRLPARVRLWGTLGVVAVVAAAAAMLEIRGVTGDVVPIVAWRWTPRELPPPELAEREAPAPGPPPPERVERSAPAPEPESAPAPAAPPATADERPAAEAQAGDLAEAAEPAATRIFPKPEEEAPPPPAPGFRYDQFLGPGRDATVHGIHLARDWRRTPPKLVWRQPIGAGWSSFAVAGGTAVTQEQRGELEMVVAYDLASGRMLWAHSDPVRFETVLAGVGPRATPTLAGGRVYAFGARGLLNALDLATGRRLWSRDVLADAGAGLPEHGKSSSPLVVDGRVVVSAGGRDGRSLVAYDAATGELAWAGGDDGSGYSSPLLVTLAGVPQIVIFNQASVAAHDPADGRVLWSHPWPRDQPNVAQPLPLGPDLLLVSSGYGIGAKLLRIDRRTSGELGVDLVWESPRLKAKFTNLVVHRSHVYGLDDGVLVCLDPATGERCWKRGRYGHGQVLLVDDLLLVQAENGEVVLVEPDPGGLRELGRFPALADKTWNHPVLVGPYLLVRNHKEAACYELPLAAASG